MVDFARGSGITERQLEFLRTTSGNERDLLAKDLLTDLLLYRELKAEHDEILRHKWFESEKAGHDIGFDVAMIDWKLKHFSGWRRARQKKLVSLNFQI